MRSESATRGGLRRVLLQSVQVDDQLAIISGCGTFYSFVIPESYAITLVVMRNTNTWTMHSWQVDTDGLHGPPEPCR